MKKVQQAMQAQFDKMCATGKLFKAKISGSEVWKTYLKSFPAGTDPKFRDPESSSHNCNNCHNFIRRYGNVVAITATGGLTSIFAASVDEEYTPSFAAMQKLLSESEIENVFFETYAELNSLPYETCKPTQTEFKLGIASNHKQYTQEEAVKFGQVNSRDIYTFEHMMVTLPTAFVKKDRRSLEAIQGEYRDKYNVFKRAVLELPKETLLLVRDLIAQGSLLNGDSYLPDLTGMITTLEEYNASPKQDSWFWSITYNMPERIAKFKNTLMGTLCTELAQGEEINKACMNWNKRADPVNYMKAVAPITKKQIEEAEKLVAEQGYADSFHRRLATLEDINIDEILFTDAGSGKVKAASVFDKVKDATPQSRHKRNEFKDVEEVSVDKFMKDILPTCTSVEVFLENKLESNLVALTTAEDKDAKIPFKWDNPFSWTFNGNLAGKSQITEAVKSAGGKIDGVLRFSIMWNESGDDILDFDAHCIYPKVGTSSNEIFFGAKSHPSVKASLDVDMMHPRTLGVENIVFTDLRSMPDGDYKFLIRRYSGINKHGFKAEIVFGGQKFTYNHPAAVSAKDKVVAHVTLKDGNFTIKHNIPCEEESKKVWNLETNNFHKVKLVCPTPNHWGKNNVGNKHYLFMLENCKVDSPIRGFHVENLNQDLSKIRKVTEVLGNTTMINPTSKQLCGVGFNSTVKDEVILKLGGNFKRTIKVKF